MKTHHLKRCLAALLFAAAGFASAEPRHASDGSAGSNTPELSSVTVTPHFVTPGFVRMHHPEALAALALKVSKGNASKATLVNLAGPTLADSLLKSNLNALTGPKRTNLELKGLGALLNLPTQLAGADYNPHAVTYSNLIPGETQQESLSFTSPVEGTVTATVSANGDKFQVEQLQSLTGEAFFGNQGTIMAPDQTTTGAPLPVKAGQQFTILMKFGAATAGTYAANLNVACSSANGGWQVTLPLKIVVSPNNNYKAAYTGFNPTIVTFPSRKFTLTIPITPLNYRAPFSATIQCTGPAGIKISDTPVHFNSAKPVNVTIHGDCEVGTQVQENAIIAGLISSDDNLKSLFWIQCDICPEAIQVSFGDIESYYHVSGFQTFGSVGSFDETWKNPAVVFEGDGHFTFLGTCRDNGQGATYPLSSFLQEPGIPLGVFLVDRHGVRHGSYNQLEGYSTWVRDNWDDVSNGRLKAGAYFIVGQMRKYYDGNLPPLDHGAFTLPLKQPIVVTRW